MRKERMKILFASSEVFPFAKTGGLADVSRSLPKALTSLGHDVRTIMPFYKCVSEGGFDIVKEIDDVRHPLSGTRFGFDISSNRSDSLVTYFIDKRKHFSRKGLYGTSKGDYPDNALRFGFFSRAVLSAVEILQFKPDIIHCNDWQTGLVPFYLKTRLSDHGYYSGMKTLFTIHNLAYQGVFRKGKINFMKTGILYSDAVNTVSQQYAREIITPEFGCGLEGILKTREKDLFGIPNGVDYTEWSPEKDRFIKVNYDPDSIKNKKICKQDLLQYTGLPIPVDRPLIGCIARLADQKGMDLLADIMDTLAELDIGVVILGKGDTYYNELFAELAKKYPRNVSVSLEFNDELAHKIEAGCDMFVMPSRYEPCGLNQMYSIKYGTIPIVRAIGGLDDVIIDFDENREKGNGFKFEKASKGALLGAVRRAVLCYENKALWEKLVLQAMSYDHSWKRSAEKYVKLYEEIFEE